MNNISYIKKKLPEHELLAQLAEEASELSKAALKLRRVIHAKNPTPVTYQEAYDNLTEEVADVLLCLESINFDFCKPEVHEIQDRKVNRWANRLE